MLPATQINLSMATWQPSYCQSCDEWLRCSLFNDGWWMHVVMSLSSCQWSASAIFAVSVKSTWFCYGAFRSVRQHIYTIVLYCCIAFYCWYIDDRPIFHSLYFGFLFLLLLPRLLSLLYLYFMCQINSVSFFVCFVRK